MRSANHRILTLLLVAFVAVWGWTFAGNKQALASIDVMGFLAVRFAIATAVIGLLAWRRFQWRSFAVGSAMGLVLASTYLLQTYGLDLTTSTNNGMITGLFILFVPIANRLLFGVRIERSAWPTIAASLLGLVLLTGQAPGGFNLGDLLTVLCAVTIGLHVALLDRYAAAYEPESMAFGQIATAAAIFTVLWPATAVPSIPPPQTWAILLATGVVATAGAFYIQILVQQKLSAIQTASILMLEPVFAALFAYWLMGDRLGPVQWAGAALMVFATAGSQLHHTRRDKRPAAARADQA